VIRTQSPLPLRGGAFKRASFDFAPARNAEQPSRVGVRLLKTLASVSLALCLAAPTALATETEPLHVAVRDQTGCADEESFMTSVRARSARIREAAPGETARALRVVIERGADGTYRGELTVIDDDREGAWGRSRSIEMTTCQEVVDALALFTVLAIDPTAITGETETETETETATETEVPPPLQTPKPALDSPQPKTRGHMPKWRDGPKARARALFGISSGIFAAGTPTPLLAGGIFSEIGYQDSGEVGVRFGPSARLWLTMTSLARVRMTEGSAGLHWTQLGLDLCPVVLRLTRALALRPCVSVSEGLLEASGRIDEPKNVVAPFRTIGVLARGEWILGRHWLLELSGGVARPFRRDQFYFEPSTSVYQSPPVVGVVTVGGGYRFL
jgi:hypothetical protein